MKLPEAEKAVVPRRKIVDYLLDLAHPDGGPKAAFFLRFGFTAEAWHRMAAGLKQHAVQNEVGKVVENKLGTRYSVEGELETPDGRNPLVRTIWFIANDETVPRFVTAYPKRGRR